MVTEKTVDVKLTVFVCDVCGLGSQTKKQLKNAKTGVEKTLEPVTCKYHRKRFILQIWFSRRQRKKRNDGARVLL